MNRVDWFRVLVELKRHGLSGYGVAERVGIPRQTLHNYANRGCEPRYVEGVLLLELWAEVTGQELRNVPREVASTSAAKAR